MKIKIFNSILSLMMYLPVVQAGTIEIHNTGDTDLMVATATQNLLDERPYVDAWYTITPGEWRSFYCGTGTTYLSFVTVNEEGEYGFVDYEFDNGSSGNYRKVLCFDEPVDLPKKYIMCTEVDCDEQSKLHKIYFTARVFASGILSNDGELTLYIKAKKTDSHFRKLQISTPEDVAKIEEVKRRQEEEEARIASNSLPRVYNRIRYKTLGAQLRFVPG